MFVVRLLIDKEYNFIKYVEGNKNDYKHQTKQMKRETVNSNPPWFINVTTFDYVKVVGKVYSIGNNALS